MTLVMNSSFVSISASFTLLALSRIDQHLPADRPWRVLVDCSQLTRGHVACKPTDGVYLRAQESPTLAGALLGIS